MKNALKILVIAVLVSFSVQTFAQKFGIQGGINLDNLLVKDDVGNYSEELNFENNLGFNAGVTMNIGLTNLIDLEIAALAETKGFKITEGSDYMKTRLVYADIPVLLRVGPTLGPVKIFGAVGPFIGFGIAGKDLMKFDGEKDSEKIQWGNSAEEDDFKRLDFGAKFGVGAEAMKFSLGFYYSLGLANISAYQEEGTMVKTRSMSISLGYRF